MTISTIDLVRGLGLLVVLSGCWRIGEPTTSEAVVAWAAWPDTVAAGEQFPFEFAGPISPNACGRLDTALVVVTDSTVELSARRTTYETMCSDTPVSFYEVRAMELPPGTYTVRAGEHELGRIVALEGGTFAPMHAAGLGTLERAGECLLFGPGQMGNQRPFALIGRADRLAGLDPAVGSRRLAHVRGTLAGFTLCGTFGSRPAIRVSEARLLDREADDYYEE